MNRRAFMQSVLLTAVAAPLSGSSLSAQAQEQRRRAGWIIPTNKPDSIRLEGDGLQSDARARPGGLGADD